jgi:Na+-transporting NADH:ubiquinone oxidoreductase subunit NqrD
MSKEKEPLFSKKNRALLTDPLDDDNPITVQVLGICSALAITVKLEPAVRYDTLSNFCNGSWKCYCFYFKKCYTNKN